MIPARWPHTKAIRDRLASTGIAAEFGEVPAGAGWSNPRGAGTFVPYFSLYAFTGGSLDGPLSSPDVDAEWLWQVTAVGATAEQCEWAADKARMALLGPLTVPGRSVSRISLEQPDGARPDDTVRPRVWICTERYRLMSTP